MPRGMDKCERCSMFQIRSGGKLCDTVGVVCGSSSLLPDKLLFTVDQAKYCLKESEMSESDADGLIQEMVKVGVVKNMPGLFRKFLDFVLPPEFSPGVTITELMRGYSRYRVKDSSGSFELEFSTIQEAFDRCVDSVESGTLDVQNGVWFVKQILKLRLPFMQVVLALNLPPIDDGEKSDGSSVRVLYIIT